MQNSQRNRRQTRLTVYRFATTIMLVALLAMVGTLIIRSFQPTTPAEATKVERATSFLQDVGFEDPVYLGITPGQEGEYPTFHAKAIGGEPIQLWIRTTRNGGWEIQPVGLFETISSADDLARIAASAVYRWENIPPDIQPRTDGAWGQYESREYRFNLLARYATDSYTSGYRDETTGWPPK